MSDLGAILGWKHNHEPGIRTKGDTIVEWPVSLGKFPDQADIDLWTTEYEAFLVTEASEKQDVKTTLAGLDIDFDTLKKALLDA